MPERIVRGNPQKGDELVDKDVGRVFWRTIGSRIIREYVRATSEVVGVKRQI